MRTEAVRARTNSEWVRELSAGGEEQAAALESCGPNWCEPHATRWTEAWGGRRTSRRSTSTKLAQDALLTIFEHLTDFRGDSRFTTWVYKFAINMALAAARRDAWKHVSLDTLLEQASRPTWHLAAEARRWLKDGLLLDEGGRLVLPDLEGIRALVERQEE